MRRKDFTGQKFGRLMVTGYTGRKRGLHYEVLCLCECGNILETATTSLVQGSRVSCGCHQIKHGMCDSQEYSSWKGMKSRCYVTSNARYHDYGGRGIEVCERWRNSFENFYADMGGKPTPLHSIEREDVNGHYEPGNCVWATPAEQSRNKRFFGSKTNARGVHPMPNGRSFKANITVDNKTIHIGVYGSVGEAKQARETAEINLWGRRYAG